MRKFFTFLFAALMSVGMCATTYVTITQNDFPGMDVSFTKDGVTVSADWIDNMDGGHLVGPGSFSTTLGNFTKIEVNAGDITPLGEGWSGNTERQTWTGNASSVSFSGEINGLGHGITIMCTIEESAPTTYTLQLVADPAMGSVALQNPSSDIIDNGNGNYTVPENAEVTILATPLEGYKFTGWKTGNIDDMVGCYYCGTALNTEDNPYTFTMTADVAYLAEFEAAAPAGKPVVVFEANGNRKEVEVESFPHTFWCDCEYEDGELDVIIQELYALSRGGYCDYFYDGPVATGNPAVTAGADDDANHFITISEAFEGTATVSGKYNKYTDIDEDLFDYTLTISTKGAATAISNTAVDTKAVKRIVNGQLLIIRDGKLFNVQGAQVR